MKKAIFITVEGGMIQNICATEDALNTQITIIDFDIEGVNGAELSKALDDRLALIYDHTIYSIDDGDNKKLKELMEG